MINNCLIAQHLQFVLGEIVGDIYLTSSALWEGRGRVDCYTRQLLYLIAELRSTEAQILPSYSISLFP